MLTACMTCVAVRPERFNSRSDRGVYNLSNSKLGESMESTEEGLKLVKTLKFAQMVDDYLSPWREQEEVNSVAEDGLLNGVIWSLGE